MFDSNDHAEESRPLSGRSFEIFERISSRNGGPIKEEDFDPQVLTTRCGGHRKQPDENDRGTNRIYEEPTEAFESGEDVWVQIRRCATTKKSRIKRSTLILARCTFTETMRTDILIFVEKIVEVYVDYLKKDDDPDEALHVRMVCQRSHRRIEKTTEQKLDKVVYKHIWVMDLADVKWSSFTHDVRDPALHKILK